MFDIFCWGLKQLEGMVAKPTNVMVSNTEKVVQDPVHPQHVCLNPKELPMKKLEFTNQLMLGCNISRCFL